MPSDARAVAQSQIEERRNSQADRGDERPRRESRHGGGGGGHRRSSQHRGDGDRRRSTRSGAGASSSNDSPTTGPSSASPDPARGEGEVSPNWQRAKAAYRRSRRSRVDDDDGGAPSADAGSSPEPHDRGSGSPLVPRSAEAAALEAKVREQSSKLREWERAYERAQGAPPSAEEKASSGTYTSIERKLQRYREKLDIEIAATGEAVAPTGTGGGGGGSGGGGAQRRGSFGIAMSPRALLREDVEDGGGRRNSQAERSRDRDRGGRRDSQGDRGSSRASPTRGSAACAAASTT